MKIGTCQARKGEMARGELRVARDPKAGPLSIPIVIARGYEEGTTLFLSTGVHGDELNGIVILQRFMQNLDITALRGTIIFLPLVNGAGFEVGQRKVPYDDRDLNRCFPGDVSGSVSEQMAHTIFTEVIARCDFGIDVHDSGRGSVLLPHPRAQIRDEAGGYDPARMKPIAAFGTDIIMLCRGMEGVMTIEANRHLGVPAFTVEAGGAMILWEDFIRRALVGLKNVLIYHEMMEGRMVLPHQQFVIPGEDDISVKASVDGILYRKTELGKAVNQGEVLAEIYNPITAESQIVRASQCGVVHDLNVHAKINAGEDVVGVLAFATCPEQGRKPSAVNVEAILNAASDRVQLRCSEVFDEALTLQV
jgi:predicted deacylase